MSRLMEHKKGLILGVANENSISWGVAKVLAENGAELAFTYQNDITGKYVIPLFQSVGSQFYEILDVTNDERPQCFGVDHVLLWIGQSRPPL
jgi:enoyl-[acyl-carrier protein] reductase I